MGILSRLELPAEFYDITSNVLLTQPEPQYLYAQFFKAAQMVDLSASAGEFGLPGRSVGGNGADYSSAERDRLMLSNPISSSVVVGRNNMQGLPGHTLRFNRPSFTDSTYTEASRKVATGQSISTTPIAVDSEQVTLTLARYAGPYAGSAVAPYGIDALDATLGVHKLSSIVGTHLKRDYDKFLDKVQVALLDLGAAVYPAGMAADNDATSVGMFPFTYQLVNSTERQMDDANLPTFSDGYRCMVLHPIQCEQLKNDPQYARYAMFHPQYNALFPGYVGSIGKMHIFKSTTLTSGNNGSSVAIYRGHAIAPGVLLGGSGRPARVAPSTDDNYGETAKVIWLADLAFGLADSRFVRTVRSSA
jgi:hypothetical protein